MITYAKLASGPASLDELARFIAELNRAEEHHIGYLGTDAREIATALQEADVPPHEAFIVAREGDVIVGAFGFEADTELGRAWLYGPFVRHPDWAGIADRLWAEVQPLIPAAAHERELFCEVENVNCCAFAIRHRFPPRSEDAILQFDRRSLAQLSIVSASEKLVEKGILEGRPPQTPPSQTVFELSPADQAAFEQLHDRLFPDTYYAGRQIIGRLDQRRKVFVALEDTALQGYVYVEAQPEFGEGNIEFIGVAEGARSRGIGRKLLAAALGWMFAFEGIESIFLSVNATNTAALALYRSAGFQLLHTMRSFRSAPHAPGFSILNS
jgi:ribosomal protein S18 acetylase RimI-like enzyme